MNNCIGSFFRNTNPRKENASQNGNTEEHESPKDQESSERSNEQNSDSIGQ
jgi:hypothetical protein